MRHWATGGEESSRKWSRIGIRRQTPGYQPPALLRCKLALKYTRSSKNTRDQNNMFIQPANGLLHVSVGQCTIKKTTYSPNTYRRQHTADQWQHTPTEDLAMRLIGRLMNLINADGVSVDNRHTPLLLHVLRWLLVNGWLWRTQNVRGYPCCHPW